MPDLSLAIRALIEDFEYQRNVDAAAGSTRFLDGCAAVWGHVLPQLRKAVDGTLTDEDLEYAEMLVVPDARETR